MFAFSWLHTNKAETLASSSFRMQRIKFHSFAEILHYTMKARLHSKDQPCSKYIPFNSVLSRFGKSHLHKYTMIHTTITLQRIFFLKKKKVPNSSKIYTSKEVWLINLLESQNVKTRQSIQSVSNLWIFYSYWMPLLISELEC